MKKKGDYPVGYRRPPKAHQFKPGQSGNPGGRPCGSSNLTTVVAQEMQREVTVTTNGQPEKMKMMRAIGRMIVMEAAKGNVRMLGFLLASGLAHSDSDVEEFGAPDRERLLALMKKIKGDGKPD